ncbi:MAG: Uma2 family endonuclease [Halothece sp.]
MLLTSRKADRVVLHDICWEQFESLLTTLGDKRAARIAYDYGVLEIMTPLPEHEYYKQVITTAIEDIAEVLEQNYECYGSTTWKRKIQEVGVEPDNCFYFQNEAKVRGKLQFDLNSDPPPDLVLEIDLTNKSLNRFPIYARLGVPEIWTYDQGQLTIYQLQEETYQIVSTSSIFPALPIQELPRILEQNQNQGRLTLRKAVREWASQAEKS